MHDAFNELTRGRSLDDFLAESDGLATRLQGEALDREIDSALHRMKGRRSVRVGGSTANAFDVVQRALHSRAVDEGRTLDGWTGRPLASLPRGSSPAPHDVQIVREQSAIAPPGEEPLAYAEPTWGTIVGIVVADGIEPADDHVKTTQELAADAELRRRRRAGEDAAEFAALPLEEQERRRYDGVEECAVNRGRDGRSRKAQGKGSGDKGPRARPLRGATTDELHERLLSGGPEPEKTLRPKVVAGRVDEAAKETLDADDTASNGELMQEIAVLMQRTGMTKAQVRDELRRLRETGMCNPDVVDAIDPPPTSSAA